MKIVAIKNVKYERTEDGDKYYFKEISNRKNKTHFTLTKDKAKIKEAEFGLKVFWTEVFS